MLKGDATWATRKIVLGWILDTVSMNVQLSYHRVTRLFEISESIAPKQHRTTVNKCHTLFGEPRSMILAIPGGRGLFSILQDALRTKGKQGTQISFSSAVHLLLADVRWLVTEQTHRPTRIVEITPKKRPDTLGT
jgi:hypothetical protein